MYDLCVGGPQDLADIVDSAEYGIRAAFAGTEWATVRDEVSDVAEIYINEFNEQVAAMG